MSNIFFKKLLSKKTHVRAWKRELFPYQSHQKCFASSWKMPPCYRLEFDVTDWFSVVVRCVIGTLVILPGCGRSFWGAWVLGIQYGVVIPWVTFEEDFSFQLDKVVGLLSKSRQCSQGQLFRCRIPGAINWSGNALCQLGLVFCRAPRHWGTSAGNYFEHLALMFNAFLSRA